MRKYITAESFGSMLPDNWEIATEIMNEKIDALPEYEDERDERDAIDEIWEAYCRGDYDEEIERRERNVWYAVLRGTEDNDWGTGSHDLTEAVEMVRRLHANGEPDAYIAVIDDTDPDGFCLDEIHDIEA